MPEQRKNQFGVRVIKKDGTLINRWFENESGRALFMNDQCHSNDISSFMMLGRFGGLYVDPRGLRKFPLNAG